MRRRRRRGGPGLSARGWAVLLGAAGVLIIGGVFTLMGVADRAEPDEREMRIELPNALKD